MHAAATHTIAVIGATGRTGAWIVDLALLEGVAVRALLRDASRYPVRPGVTVIEGDSIDGAALERLVVGADAVISAVGQRGDINAPQTRRRETVAALIPVLQRVGPRRVVAIASAGVVPRADGRLAGEVDLPPQFQRIFLDHRATYEYLAATDLDWVVLCPPNIPDGSPTGRALTAIDTVPDGASGQITTGELARIALATALTTTPTRARLVAAEPAN